MEPRVKMDPLELQGLPELLGPRVSLEFLEERENLETLAKRVLQDLLDNLERLDCLEQREGMEDQGLLGLRDHKGRRGTQDQMVLLVLLAWMVNMEKGDL